MTENKIKDFLEEISPSGDFILVNGFEEAFIGTVTRYSMDPIALYDHDKCIAILVEQGMSEESAAEYFGFNILGSWNGDSTPAFAMLTREVMAKLGS